MCCFELA